MEKEERMELVTNLYGLRAGLSAISIENDNCQAFIAGEDKKITDIKNENKKLSAANESDYGEICKNNIKINEHKSDLESYEKGKSIAEDPNTYYSARARHNSQVGKAIAWLVGGLVIIAGVIVFCIFDIAGSKGSVFSKILMWGLAVSVIGVVSFFCIRKMARAFSHIEKHKSKSYYADTAKDYDNQMSEVKADISELIEKNAALTKNMTDNRSKMDQNVKLLATIESEKKAGIEPYRTRAIAINDALVAQYNDLIDVRDWGNLDLVIYMLETRRADSLKEALQQVDMERRKNEIVYAISEASQAVCSSIQDGLRQLQVSMVTCFKIISDQIDASFAETNAKLSGISGQMSGISNKIDLGNALMAKASVSSTQLMNDVNYIRRALG